MSRFSEGDGENPICYVWGGQIERICRGKRGQKVLREFIDALLALPERRLIADKLVNRHTGEVCAVGAFAKYKGADLAKFDDDTAADEYETRELGKEMGLGSMLSWELGYINDVQNPGPSLRRKYVQLDDGIPMIDERAYRMAKLYGGRPMNFAENASRQQVVTYIDDEDAVSPEQRWRALYDWASSRVRWNLPVPA